MIFEFCEKKSMLIIVPTPFLSCVALTCVCLAPNHFFTVDFVRETLCLASPVRRSEHGSSCPWRETYQHPRLWRLLACSEITLSCLFSAQQLSTHQQNFLFFYQTIHITSSITPSPTSDLIPCDKIIANVIDQWAQIHLILIDLCNKHPLCPLQFSTNPRWFTLFDHLLD